MTKVTMVIIIALAGMGLNCSVVVKTTVGDKGSLEARKSVAIICKHDDLELKKEIEEGITKLGFTLADSSGADLLFNISYDHYFDVFHNTSNLINIIITDRNRIVLTSGFSGDTPYSSSGLVERILDDIRVNLRGKSN